MSFTNTLFLFIFLPLSLLVFYMADTRIREYVLFALSIVFYSFGALQYIYLFIAVITVTVIVGRIMDSVNHIWLRRLLLIGGIVLNIGILLRYKILIALSDPAFAPLLPLGISFYAFKAVSYLVDLYNGRIELKNFPIVHDALYLSFFPQIQSGPLTRYTNMILSPDRLLFSKGAYRFLTGFSKKILLADVLSHVTTEVFSTPTDSFSASYAWLGSICYSLQLYYDFSGYSDMAIGISEMFGYKCVENFDHPYITESVSKFWRRWHISLSEWFRDYVYIPLGGSRNKSQLRVYFNLFAVWLLTGLWHGISLNFIVWGLGYFVLISLERLTHLPDRLDSRLSKGLYRVFTLLFINCQWVIFRAESLGYGVRFILRMFIPTGSSPVTVRTGFLIREYAILIVIAIVLCLPVTEYIGKLTAKRKITHTVYQWVHSGVVIAAFAAALSFVISGSNNPFVYANF